MKFSRRSRLLKPAEFKLVFQEPIRSGDDFFRVLARHNSTHYHRLGMAVSKKNCAKAVDRNRIKRVVRENFRTTIAGQSANYTMDFVVIPTIRAAKKSNNILKESLSIHWQKLIRKAGARDTGDRNDQPRIQR